MRWAVSSNEADSCYFISLWCIVELIIAISDNFSSQIDSVLLLKAFLVGHSVQDEVKFASIDSNKRACVIDASQRKRIFVLVLSIMRAFDSDYHSKQV